MKKMYKQFSSRCVKLCLLQVVIVATAFAAQPRSNQMVYITNQATLLHTLEVYVNNNEAKKIASGRQESFANSFRTLSYKDKSGTLVPIVDENEMAWHLDSDLHVVFTYERPAALRSGEWKMQKEWHKQKKQEAIDKGWTYVHTLSPEEMKALAQDPTRDPKALEQLKNFLTSDPLVSTSRENQSKFLDKTFPTLSKARKEEILNSL